MSFELLKDQYVEESKPISLAFDTIRNMQKELLRDSIDMRVTC